MENQINVGDQNTQQVGQNPVNQMSPLVLHPLIPKRKIKFSFRFFKYLNIIEKIGYIASFIIGLLLATNYIITAINSIRSGKADFGGGDLIILSIVLIPFLITNNIRLKGLKKIPENEKSDFEFEQLKEAETSGHQLSSVVKRFIIVGSVISVISMLIFLAVYFLIFNRAPYPISEYIPPNKPCDPPREVKVLSIQPPKYVLEEPNVPIQIQFNENMDTNTFNEESIKICTRIVAPGEKREDIFCQPIQTKNIHPSYEYLKENMLLTIKAKEGEWGNSDDWYETWVEVTVSEKAKSICGLPVTTPYHSLFSLKRKKGRFVQPSSQPTTQITPSPDSSETSVKIADLVIENSTVTEENGQYIARGNVKNNTSRKLQPVNIKWSFLDNSGSSFASDEILINQLGKGLVEPGEVVQFITETEASKPYSIYTIEAFVKCQTVLPCNK